MIVKRKMKRNKGVRSAEKKLRLRNEERAELEMRRGIEIEEKGEHGGRQKKEFGTHDGESLETYVSALRILKGRTSK